MSVIIIAGPPAVGHNTIAEILATLLPRFAVVDLDEVRGMVRTPATAPWVLGEGVSQYAGAIRRAGLIATDLSQDRFDVAVLDVAPPETLALFRVAFPLVKPKTVLLMAPADELVRRDTERHPDPERDPDELARWHERIRFLHGQLSAAQDRYDAVIDNSGDDPHRTAQELLRFFEQ